jgi:hypothetical protein
MAVTNKQYVVYYMDDVPDANGNFLHVGGFYGSLSAAQERAQELDNNQNIDVWIIKMEQHRN